MGDIILPPAPVVETIKGQVFERTEYQILRKLVPEYNNFFPITLNIGYYPLITRFLYGTGRYGGDSGYIVGAIIDDVLDMNVIRIRTASTANYDAYATIYPYSDPYDILYTHGAFSNMMRLFNAMSVYKCRVRIMATTALRVVITGNTIDADLTAMVNDELPYFRVFTDLGEVNWIACQRDSAGGETVVNTGIALDTAWHTFKIECLSDRSKYYIDDTLVAEITTNLDRIRHHSLYLGFTIRTLEAVAKEMRVVWSLSGWVF